MALSIGRVERNRVEVLADALPGQLVRDVVLVLGYAAFVGVTAQLVIRLPFTPVPITGQTFGVLIGGMALGWKRGVSGMALYVLVGLLGVPWFAGGAGGWSHVVATASFGYLLGFIVAAALVGRLAELGFDRTPWLALVAMIGGNLVIYALGLAWLAYDLHVGFGAALQLGMTPFLAGDLVKALLAAGVLPAAWLLVGRR